MAEDIFVYKLPTDMTTEEFLDKIPKGELEFGPITDANNNVVISSQEWDSPQMKEFLAENPDISKKFTMLKWNPAKDNKQ